MPSLLASGTVTADGTEQDLATDTTNKTVILVVDTGAMANGDVVDLKLYTKVLDGGTERLAYQATYAHAQSEANKYSVPVPANIHLRATLKQVAGSNKAYPWALLSP